MPSPSESDLDVSGFGQNESPYLDALELLDLVPKGLS
jgi:hypothetical protein